MAIKYIKEEPKIKYIDEEAPQEKIDYRGLASRSLGPAGMLANAWSGDRPNVTTGSPTTDALRFAHKEVFSPIAQGVSTGLFGVPRAIAEGKGEIGQFLKQSGKSGALGPMGMALGYGGVRDDDGTGTFTEQETGAGKTLRLGSEALGLFGGGASQLARGAAEKIGGGTLLREGTKGVVGGGTFGLTQLGRKGEFGEQLTQGAIGSTIGGLTGFGAKAIQRIKQAGGGKEAVNLAEKIRKEFYKVKSGAVKEFSSQLDDLAQANPDRGVNLRDTIEQLSKNLDDMAPEARNAIKKIPGVQKLIDNPELAQDIGVRETQDMINYINTKIPKTIKATHLDIIDASNDLRVAQLEAFPEMSSVRANYAKIIAPWKNVKSQFGFNKVLKGIQKDFGGPEGKAAVEELLTPEMIRDMGGYKSAYNLVKNSKDLISKLIIGGIGIEAIRRILINPVVGAIESGAGGEQSGGGGYGG